MTTEQHDTRQIRQILIDTAQKRSTLDYKSLARALGFQPPNTIQKTVAVLEACQEEDAQLNRPQLASVVIQKSGTACPRPGFFQKLDELGVYHGPDRGPDAERWHHDELEKVYRYYPSAAT